MGKFNKDFIENITNTSIRDANWSSMAGNGKSQNDIRETYPHVFFHLLKLVEYIIEHINCHILVVLMIMIQ